MTIENNKSEFVDELEKDYEDLQKRNRIAGKTRACPECGDKLVARKGKYGMFLGCNNYPVCRYTEKIRYN